MWQVRIAIALVAALLAGAGVAATSPATAQTQSSSVKQVLAPTGKLRVGVYPGSPTSMVRTATGETHGVSFDLGQELARRLGVPFEPVTYRRIAEVIEGMKTGGADFTVTNATAARALEVTFSQTLLSLELGYLVPASSPIRSVADIDKAGNRIGVTQGSTSQRTLPKLLLKASVVPAPSLKDAAKMMADKQLEAYATNKSILFKMAEGMPGARVLDGRWGEEHMAAAIPKGREQALEYLRAFVEDVQRSGILARATERAGLKGTIQSQ